MKKGQIKKPSRGSQVPSFLQKTYDIVDVSTIFCHKFQVSHGTFQKKETNHIVCWCQDGRSFVIKSQTQFIGQILPKNFKHQNFASFVRQLNMYGFHKEKSSGTNHIFSHQKFRRGKRELLAQIHRKPTNHNRSTTLINGARVGPRTEVYEGNLYEKINQLIEENQVLKERVLCLEMQVNHLNRFSEKVRDKASLQNFMPDQSMKETLTMLMLMLLMKRGGAEKTLEITNEENMKMQSSSQPNFNIDLLHTLLRNHLFPGQNGGQSTQLIQPNDLLAEIPRGIFEQYMRGGSGNSFYDTILNLLINLVAKMHGGNSRLVDTHRNKSGPIVEEASSSFRREQSEGGQIYSSDQNSNYKYPHDQNDRLSYDSYGVRRKSYLGKRKSSLSRKNSFDSLQQEPSLHFSRSNSMIRPSPVWPDYDGRSEWSIENNHLRQRAPSHEWHPSALHRGPGESPGLSAFKQTDTRLHTDHSNLLSGDGLHGMYDDYQNYFGGASPNLSEQAPFSPALPHFAYLSRKPSESFDYGETLKLDKGKIDPEPETKPPEAPVHVEEEQAVPFEEMAFNKNTSSLGDAAFSKILFNDRKQSEVADVKGVAREKSYFTGKEKEGALLSAKVELEPEKKKKYKQSL